MKPQADDFQIYLTSIGQSKYQLFINNETADTDFIRIHVGLLTNNGSDIKGDVIYSRIISPLKPSSRKVFLQEFNSTFLKNSRVWIVFEAVNRNVGEFGFIGLSPTSSKWLKTIGVNTPFEIKGLELEKSIDRSLKSVFELRDIFSEDSAKIILNR